MILVIYKEMTTYIAKSRSCCGLLFCHCMSLHVCTGDFFFFFFFFFFSFIFEKETVILAFCLQCFDYGAFALRASFFPFVGLDGRC